MNQEKLRELPKDPNMIIRAIRESTEPTSEAFAYGRSLMLLTEPEKKDFWYKSEPNLLSLILMYVAKSESFVPAMIATGCLAPAVEEVTEEQRSAAEVIDCMEDPVTFRLVLEDAMHKSNEDKKLLRYSYNAYMTSKVRDNVASNLAVESEITEYLTYGR